MRWWLVRIGMLLATTVGLYVASKLLSDNMDAYYYRILIQCGVYITLAVSLNLINGITGQFSIGHAGFYAIGAYFGAAWTTLWRPGLEKSFPALHLGTATGDALTLVIALLIGAVAAGLAGFLVGLPSLRLRGDYLAIVTLGFGEMIRVLVLNIDAVGGSRGMSGIPTLVESGGLAAFWVFGLVLIAMFISFNLLKSARGLTWLAVREDEIAADAMGVNTTKVKVTAFVIGSAFAGAAGVLYAHYFNLINPDVFDMNTSIVITTMVVLGGTGSVSGAVIAATMLTALPELLRFLKDYRMVIYSTLLVVMMLTRPQGLFGHKELNLGWLLRRRRRTLAEGGVAP